MEDGLGQSNAIVQECYVCFKFMDGLNVPVSKSRGLYMKALLVLLFEFSAKNVDSHKFSEMYRKCCPLSFIDYIHLHP